MQKLVFAALPALFTATAVAEPVDDVRCRETAFSRAAESRDLEAFESFLDSDARFVGGRVMRGPEEIVSAQASPPPGTAAQPEEPMDERDRVRAALEANRWRRAATAEALGISRATLWRKMREYGLS